MISEEDQTPYYGGGPRPAAGHADLVSIRQLSGRDFQPAFKPVFLASDPPATLDLCLCTTPARGLKEKDRS